MIDKTYVLTMARYNAWQNKQLMEVIKQADEDLLTKDLGAFFGSIMGTMNHILWGDTLWMARWCTDVEKPSHTIAQSTAFTQTLGVWEAERFRMDGRMRIWAETLSHFDLMGDLTWFSGAQGREVTCPIAQCIVHMFNHQTHHRGQVHGLLTANGLAAPTTDLIFMPKDS